MRGWGLPYYKCVISSHVSRVFLIVQTTILVMVMASSPSSLCCFGSSGGWCKVGGGSNWTLKWMHRRINASSIHTALALSLDSLSTLHCWISNILYSKSVVKMVASVLWRRGPSTYYGSCSGFGIGFGVDGGAYDYCCCYYALTKT